MKKIILFVMIILPVTQTWGVINPFAKWTKTELTLCNSVVSRTIQLPTVEGTFVTTSYKPFQGDYGYFSYNCTDFQFEVNDIVYSGKGRWELLKIEVADDSNNGSGAAFRAEDYGIEYYKLDFAVVTSAYTYDHNQSGCYSGTHAGHKDHNESLFTNYERLWNLFDELHEVRPELFIDCTFETLGATQAVDYALVKHAEGDWLSNFAGAEGEKTDIRIRNMAWWRSPAMPATALVIGNPQMQDPGWETHIKSIAGALPIMLGDPRKLSGTDLKKYRSYADWLQLMEEKYSIMSYRQDLPGFGEPMEGMWDGFQRINTESKSGGIIGVFRHGAIDTKRIVTVNWLDPLKVYHVKSFEGKVVAILSGSEIKAKGFTVTLNGLYSGELFEIDEKE